MNKTIDYDDFDFISEYGMDMDDFYQWNERLQVLLEAEKNFITPFITNAHRMPPGWYEDDDYEVDHYYDQVDANEHLVALYYDFRAKLQQEIAETAIKRIFRNQIAEELISAAMHPNRINKLIQQSDDIEDFFNKV